MNSDNELNLLDFDDDGSSLVFGGGGSSFVFDDDGPSLVFGGGGSSPGFDDDDSYLVFGEDGSFHGFGGGGSFHGFGGGGSSPGFEDDHPFSELNDFLNPNNKRKDGTDTFSDSGTGAHEESSRPPKRYRTRMFKNFKPSFLSSSQVDQIIGSYRLGSTDIEGNVLKAIRGNDIEGNADEIVCRYQKDLFTITLKFSILSSHPGGEVAEKKKLFKQDVIICPLENEWKNNRTQIRFVEFSNERMIERYFSVSKSENETTTVFEYGTGLILYHLLKDVCPFFPKPEMLFLTTFEDTFPSIWKSYKRNGYEQPFMVATEPVITFETLKADLTNIVMSGGKIAALRVGRILKSILLQGLLAIRLLELKSFGSNGLNPSHIGFVKAKEEDDLSFKLNYPFGAETGKGKARIIDVFKDLDDDDKYILTFLMNPIDEDPYSTWNIYENVPKTIDERRSIEPTVFETEEDVENVVEDDGIVYVPDVTKPRRKYFLATGTKEMLHGFAYAFTTLVLSVSNQGDYSTILRETSFTDGNSAPYFLDVLRDDIRKKKLDEKLAEYIIEKTLLFGPSKDVELSLAVEKISETFSIRKAYEDSFKRLFPKTSDLIYEVLWKMSRWKRGRIPSATNIIKKLTYTPDSHDLYIAGENWIVMKKHEREDYPKYDWTNLPVNGGEFIGKRIPFGRFQIPFTPQTVKMSKLICSSLLSILPQRKRNDAGKMVKTTRKNEPVSPIFII